MGYTASFCFVASSHPLVLPFAQGAAFEAKRRLSASNQAISMSVNSAWAAICRHLESEKSRVQEEIRNYPAPIPACDAQFNFLLEERENLSAEVARVLAFKDEKFESDDARKSIHEYIGNSRFIVGSTKSDIEAIIDNDGL